MAKQLVCFQQDTIQGFFRHVHDTMPDFTDHQVQLLLNYMKSVGATSEAELYKMDEEDLGDLLGAKEAKIIMEYCKAKSQMVVYSEEGTMTGFLSRLADSIPSVTDRQLVLLKDYMKSTGVTSELQLYKMKEEDLIADVGAKEAGLIMRYCKAKTRERRTNSEEDYGERDRREQREQPSEGSRASSDRGSSEPRRDQTDQLTTVLQMVFEMQEKERNKNAEMIALMNKSLETVSKQMGDTVREMSAMMKQQVTLQKEVLKTVIERQEDMERRQQENHAETRKFMRGMQEFNNEAFANLSERVSAATKASEEMAKESLRREEFLARTQQQSQAETREWMKMMQDMNRESFDLLTERVYAAEKSSEISAEELGEKIERSRGKCVIQ